MIEISVVVPVYKSAECLVHLHERLRATLAEIPGSHEVVFVDDRSPDESWVLLKELAASDPSLRLVRLSRNFGQHAAITAGISEARGSWVVVMDADLQDPPEEIARLYARAQEGFEIVFARRSQRHQSLMRRIGGRVYFRIRRRLTGLHLETENSNLSIMSRKAADAFLRLRDRHRNYLLIMYWLGFEHTSIDFEPSERYAGSSSYTFVALVSLAFDSLFFHTTVLLRWIIYTGFVAATVSVVLAAYFVYSYFTHNAYPGWTSLIVLLLLIGGFILMSTGVAGLYVGKVFEQVKDRPLFIVDERVSSDSISASEG